jgi:kynurenine formamidase
MPMADRTIRRGLRWRQLPHGEYAPGELGAAHDAGPDDLLAALRIPTRGVVYDLDSGRWTGMPVHPAHAPFALTTWRTPQGVVNQAARAGDVRPWRTWSTELVVGGMHTGTHVDALNHMSCGDDNRLHGGVAANDVVGDFGVEHAEASSIPPFVCRGVLADIAGLRGVDALPAGSLVTLDEVVEALARHELEVSPGDAVLIRTGYLSHWEDRPKAAEHAGAGIGRDTAVYLAERGAVLVGADNDGLEQRSTDNPVHVELLVERGVYILELAYLDDLSRDGVHEFLFVCASPRLQGATGSFARPLAIV